MQAAGMAAGRPAQRCGGVVAVSARNSAGVVAPPLPLGARQLPPFPASTSPAARRAVLLAAFGGRPTGLRTEGAVRLVEPPEEDSVTGSLEEGVEALGELEDLLAERDDLVAELRAEVEAREDALRRARLAAMVYKLSAELGEPLEMGSLVATSSFSEIVTAVKASGEEVVVKFSTGEDNMALLRRESDNFELLHGLEGADAHVVRMLHPYRKLSVRLGDGGEPLVAGALVLEKGDWNLGGFVRARLADGRPASVAAVGTALSRWEASIAWLHSHGVLHLDIKADNAILFQSTGQVKLIDVAGMLTREEASGEDTASMDSVDLSWDTADLEEAGITYVSTVTYRQPLDLGPSRRFLDYSADWWSMGVSKLEVLGALPAAFTDGQQTTRRVWKAMSNGELEEGVRTRMAAVLLEPDPSCPEVEVWVESVMQNLRGHAAKVEYVKAPAPAAKKPAEDGKKPARKSRFAKVLDD